MDDNVMRVLRMLEEGRISAKEAEILIAAIHGESETSESESIADYIFSSFILRASGNLDIS